MYGSPGAAAKRQIAKYDTWQDQGQGGDVGALVTTLEALKPLDVTPDDIVLIQNDSKYCPDSGAHRFLQTALHEQQSRCHGG